MGLENHIIDYFGSNEEKLGVVTREHRNKLQVQTESGKDERVSEKQIISDYGAVDGDSTQAMESIRNDIRDARTDVDLELLWQTLLEVEGEPSLEDMAREYFGEPAPAERSALARALASDPVHFRRKGVSFFPRTPEEADEVAALRRKRAERAARRKRAEEWLDSVLSQRDGTVDVPEDVEEFVQQVSDFLLAGHNSDAVSMLSAARSKRSAREVALKLLEKTERLPEEADPFLLVNGIHPGFSNAVLTTVEALPPYTPDSSRLDLTGLETFSIDDEDTREIDDALSVECRDGRTLVGIHIADPAHFVRKGDMLDKVAEDRPLSLYLPTTTVTMFPEHLSCDLASLAKDACRPALSFQVTFDADGSLLDWDFGSAQVTVDHRLTYEEADARLSDPGQALHAELTALDAIAGKLMAQRESAGGFNLVRPEMKVTVENDEITVKCIDTTSPSRQLVGEMMILANRLTAEYALRHDIPIIYRVQDPPSEPVESMTTYDPVAFDRKVKRLTRTRLSTHPQPHSGLGLDLYTQISSPIRRYADLVLSRQLDAHFTDGSTAYEQQELLEVVGTVEQTMRRNRGLEREARRHWLLEYARRHLIGEEREAVVVLKEGRFVLAELDGLFERGVLFTTGEVTLGQRVKVRVRDVQPKEGKMVLEMLA